ncbi:conserved hypothetical protein [Desulfovibrionales bacterium]
MADFADVSIQMLVGSFGANPIIARLSVDMDSAVAVAVYADAVQDQLEALDVVRRRGASVALQVVPGVDTAAIQAWLGGYVYQEQAMSGPVELTTVLADFFGENFSRVLVLTGDTPDYPAALLIRALEELLHFDLVLGPAFGGGFHLLGFRRQGYRVDLLEMLPWVEPEGQDVLWGRLAKVGVAVTFMPTWNRVEEIKDLNVLMRLNRQTSFVNSRTYQHLVEHEALIRQYDIDLSSPLS